MKLEKIRFFPILKKRAVDYKNTVVVGVGGNEGAVKRRFVKLYRTLLDDRRFGIMETSSIFKNPPFGYLEQPDFYNAVMVLKTSLGARETLKILLHVEHIFGRKRIFKNGPRTLDLDIIFFNNQTIKQKDLIIPHPKWEERLSVKVPLSELKRYKG